MRALLVALDLERKTTRLTKLCAAVFFVFAASSTPALSVVADSGPTPIPYVKPGAMVAVLFDGKPMLGAKVHVWPRYRNEELYLLDTDGEGRAKLPELPAGSYSIYASIDTNAPQGQFVEVCMISCAENAFEVTDLAFDSLDGPIYAIDRSALGMSEISFDLAPDRAPGFMDTLAGAEQESAAFTLLEMSGVVKDQSGAVIPGASVAVIRKRNQENQLLTAMTTDKVGEFSARLDPGDYYAVIAAQGFKSRSIHIAITPQGSPEKAQIVLVVANLAETVTISEYRPWPR